jgi:hypothetical protein
VDPRGLCIVQSSEYMDHAVTMVGAKEPQAQSGTRARAQWLAMGALGWLPALVSQPAEPWLLHCAATMTGVVLGLGGDLWWPGVRSVSLDPAAGVLRLGGEVIPLHDILLLERSSAKPSRPSVLVVHRWTDRGAVAVRAGFFPSSSLDTLIAHVRDARACAARPPRRFGRASAVRRALAALGSVLLLGALPVLFSRGTKVACLHAFVMAVAAGATVVARHGRPLTGSRVWECTGDRWVGPSGVRPTSAELEWASCGSHPIPYRSPTERLS